ncbi:nitroreductase/quinone reductase family protein [Streptomyces lavendulae]|uniref:nitroreductase/quinone reductase family protein n=1 Tax=Streptomyces lavendulae TaxID=1914 RepID=UPI00382B4ED3
MTGTVHDNPTPWIADRIRRFEETGGHPRPGVADLLLTTRGRRSGLLCRTALAYVRDEDAYVLTASNAGADRHPAWYLNLLATPEVTLQVVAAMPSYAAYRTATTREIPLVLVAPTGRAS